MGDATQISVDEYLNTSYDPDVEYVDGVLQERRVGDWSHSLVQSNLLVALSRKYPHVYAVPGLRSRTRATRYRLPDVCVLLEPPATKYLLDAAFLAIEVLSEDDSMSRVIEKLQEYAALGTSNIWVFDPRLQQMFTFYKNMLMEVEGEIIATENPRLEVTRDEVFQQ